MIVRNALKTGRLRRVGIPQATGSADTSRRACDEALEKRRSNPCNEKHLGWRGVPTSLMPQGVEHARSKLALEHLRWRANLIDAARR